MKKNDNNITKLEGVVDRIEDGKIVVIHLNDKKGSMYINRSVFNFKVYEGMWLNINISPDPQKEKEMKSQIQQLQKELLSRRNKK